MSIPYIPLQKKAREHMPACHIKPTSTWVAILIHSASNLEDAKDKDNFLWLKCHNRITVRTLKNEYFSRRPLDDFSLKFWDIFPDEGTQVSELLRYQDKKHAFHHRVLVLRTFEAADVDEEEAIDEEFEARYLEEAEARRQAQNNVIILLDDDDDDDKEMLDEQPSATGNAGSGESSRSNSSQQSEDNEKNSGRDLKRKRTTEYEDKEDDNEEEEEEDDDDDDEEEEEEVDNKRSAHSNPLIADLYRKSESILNDTEDLYESIEREIEYTNSNFDEAMELTTNRAYYDEWTEFFERLRILPKGFQSVEKESAHNCEFCGKQMFVMPWTRFGLSNHPICTACSLMAITEARDWVAKRQLEDMTRQHRERKQQRLSDDDGEGILQNMDDDAPIDYPQHLLSAAAMSRQHHGKEIQVPVWPMEMEMDPPKAQAQHDDDNFMDEATIDKERNTEASTTGVDMSGSRTGAATVSDASVVDKNLSDVTDNETLDSEENHGVASDDEASEGQSNASSEIGDDPGDFRVLPNVLDFDSNKNEADESDENTHDESEETDNNRNENLAEEIEETDNEHTDRNSKGHEDNDTKEREANRTEDSDSDSSASSNTTSTPSSSSATQRILSSSEDIAAAFDPDSPCVAASMASLFRRESSNAESAKNQQENTTDSSGNAEDNSDTSSDTSTDSASEYADSSD